MNTVHFGPTEIAAATRSLREFTASGGATIDPAHVLGGLLVGREAPRHRALVHAFLKQSELAGDVVVFGAGSHTADILPVLADMGGVNVVGILDSGSRHADGFMGFAVYGLDDLDRFGDVTVLLSHHDSEHDMAAALRARGVTQERIFGIYTNPDYIAFSKQGVLDQLQATIDDHFASGRLKSVDHVIVCSSGEPWTLMAERHLAQIFPPDRTLKVYAGRQLHFWESPIYPTVSIYQAHVLLADLLTAYRPGTVYIQTSLQFFSQGLALLARDALADTQLIVEVYDWYATFNDSALVSMYACPPETIETYRQGELLLTQVADIVISKCGGHQWDEFVGQFRARYELYYPALGDEPLSADRVAAGDGTRSPIKIVLGGSMPSWRNGETICSENPCNNVVSILDRLAAHPDINVDIYNSAHRDPSMDGDFSYYMSHFSETGVSYHHRVPYAELLEILSSMDYGLAMSSEAAPASYPYDNALAGLPNRFMGYVEAGMPVIANAALGFCADLMREYSAGIPIKWEDMDAIAERVMAQDAAQLSQGMVRMRNDMVRHNAVLLQRLVTDVRETITRNK